MRLDEDMVVTKIGNRGRDHVSSQTGGLEANLTASIRDEGNVEGDTPQSWYMYLAFYRRLAPIGVEGKT